MEGPPLAEVRIAPIPQLKGLENHSLASHVSRLQAANSQQAECARSKGRYPLPCAPKPKTKSDCWCRKTTQPRPRSSKVCKSSLFKTCEKPWDFSKAK